MNRTLRSRLDEKQSPNESLENLLSNPQQLPTPPLTEHTTLPLLQRIQDPCDSPLTLCQRICQPGTMCESSKDSGMATSRSLAPLLPSQLNSTSTYQERNPRSLQPLTSTSQPLIPTKNSLLARLSVESMPPDSPPKSQTVECHRVDNLRKQECSTRTSPSNGVVRMKRVRSFTLLQPRKVRNVTDIDDTPVPVPVQVQTHLVNQMTDEDYLVGRRGFTRRICHGTTEKLRHGNRATSAPTYPSPHRR
jgi:hypothetical protein